MLFRSELIKEAYQIRDADRAGRKWSEANYPCGYTSYASLSELFALSSTFMDLREQIDRHVQRYARQLDMDQRLHKLTMTNLWVNINAPHTYHGLHVHPLSSISGTYYVQVPAKGGQIKFEDPRLTCFMGSVPRKEKAKLENQRFVALNPEPGKVLLFESWLRHEVTQNLSRQDRVSFSFNYHY